MCEAVAICHEAGVAHRDIKPENFICCDSVELENELQEPIDENQPDFGPQAKRKVIVKLTDFGLATTEEESGDVECGSKPYMSYECRNNLGPTYKPAPADVWSLGIVLINMLFHRNPWKDPTDGDPNFDTFMIDPISFFQSKFTGIGKEVSTYLAEHVLCTEVEDRVSARELGQWIRNLPDMIGGRRAVHQLKMARLETRKQAGADKGMFIKSPVGVDNAFPKSALASALASTSNKNSPQQPSQEQVPSFPSRDQVSQEHVPTLASLPPASDLAEPSLAHPAPTPDLDNDEVRSATTVDDHPTPADMSTLVSPEPTESGDGDRSPDDVGSCTPDADDRSLSTHKRRKRGVRKGKAAQAALAAAKNDPVTQEERDAFLHELVSASEELARDLSKKKPFDANRVEDFPPLGATPAQVARKPKWKDFLAMSKGGNQQLEALARRVAERDNDDAWSAPAKLQQSSNPMSRPGHLKQTATTGSGFSQLSSIASSTTSSAADDDDWRRNARERQKQQAEERPRSRSRRGTEDLSSRARQAALAAAALTSGMEPMGSFGRPHHLNRPNQTHGTHRKSPLAADKWAPPTSSVPMPIAPVRTSALDPVQPVRGPPVPIPAARPPAPMVARPPNQAQAPIAPPVPRAPQKFEPVANGNGFAKPKPIATDVATVGSSGSPLESPKPKLKGQMSSLSKMFGGLKTKGKE